MNRHLSLEQLLEDRRAIKNLQSQMDEQMKQVRMNDRKPKISEVPANAINHDSQSAETLGMIDLENKLINNF